MWRHDGVRLPKESLVKLSSVDSGPGSGGVWSPKSCVSAAVLATEAGNREK